MYTSLVEAKNAAVVLCCRNRAVQALLCAEVASDTAEHCMRLFCSIAGSAVELRQDKWNVNLTLDRDV